jgi:hypothetical protein
MEVSCQFHAPAALLAEKHSRYPVDRKLGGSQIRSGRCEENTFLYRDSNSDPSVAQTVTSRHTDCAIPAPEIFALAKYI